MPGTSDQRGLALLMVLLLLLVLLPFAYEFSMQVQLETRTAINVTDQLKIDNEIDGQYEIMLARLRWDAQENDFDSYDDGWNDEQLRSRRDEGTGVALTTYVFDEQAKLNVRMLAEGDADRKDLFKKRLARLIELYRQDTDFEVEGGPEAWADAVASYVRKGPVRANIPTPAMADKRSILIIDELDLLPQIRGERFADLLADRRREDRTAPGLHRFITVYGSGKINLNTADEIVLRAYFFENQDIAERILERRESAPPDDEGQASSEGGELPAGNPFKDVMEVMEVDEAMPQILPANGVDPNLDFDVRTNFFSFRIVGETSTTRRDELFVVERVPSNQEDQPIEGFRLLLRQERTDPLEELEERD